MSISLVPPAWFAHRSLLVRFGVTALAVFMVLGVSLATLLDRSIESNAVDAARVTAYDTLNARVIQHLSPQDMRGPMTGRRYNAFQQFVHDTILSNRVIRLKVWRSDGTVLYSDDRRIVGQRFEREAPMLAALHGGLASDVSHLTAAENRDERRFGTLLEVYLPLRFTPHGPVLGVFETYQTYAPVAHEIAVTRAGALKLLGGGLVVLYILLFGIVRQGSNTIVRQQKQLRRDTSDLEASYRQTIASLAAAVDARDAGTERHSQRVTELTVALGRWLGIEGEALQSLERAALLHDVGKIGVPDSILLKPGPLTDGEWDVMRRHPEIGHSMLRSVAFLADTLPLVRHHHERWDGAGYPDRLAGEGIPLAARLFAVIDAYDAMTSDRPYRSGLSHAVAIERLRAGAGSHFDPQMVAAFERLMAHRLGSVSERGIITADRRSA